MKKTRPKLDLSIPQVIKNYLYATKMMLKFYPLKFCLQMIFWILANFLNFFSHTYMLRYVVNGLQEGKSVRVILSYVFFMLVINIVIDSIRAVYNNIFLPIIDCKCERRLKMELYKRSIQVDLKNYENPEDFDRFERAMSSGAGAIHNVIGSIGGAISTLISISLDSWILFEIDPVLFVFVIIPWLSSPLLVKLNKEQYEYGVEIKKINRRKNYTRRTFFHAEYAKEMRLTNIHRVMLRRFKESIEDHLKLVKSRGLRLSMVYFARSIVSLTLSVRFAQLYAIYRTLVSNTMMYGVCLVVIYSIGSLSGTANNITNIFSDIYNIALNIRDYRAFMEEEPAVSPNYNGQDPVAGDIECINMSFRYDGASDETLKRINLNIKKGERVAIVGHNGAGKTTLVKLLMRLYDPTSGTIRVADRDITEYKLKEYRNTYGVVFQDYKQLAFTVAENVLGRPYHTSDEEKVWEALKKVGLADVIDKLPNGIHSILTKEFDEDGLVLSGGQSQKLAIASIYVRDAHTVILDEPSSALDPLAEHLMYKNMRAASVGKTVIFISHRLSACVDADRIFYMENGSITETGNHRDLMGLNGKYAAMFRTQAQNYTD